MSESSRTGTHPCARCEPLRFQPTSADVDELIQTASRHALGLDFLRRGHLGTVAVTFNAHAFTVVAARERLATPDK